MSHISPVHCTTPEMNHKYQQFMKKSNSLPKINQSQGQYKYLFDLIGCKCVRDKEMARFDDECPHFYLEHSNDCQSMIMSYFQSLNADLLTKNIPGRYGIVNALIDETEEGYSFSFSSSNYEKKSSVDSPLLSAHIKDINKKISGGLDVMYSMKKGGFDRSVYLQGEIPWGVIEMEVDRSHRSKIYHIKRDSKEIAVIIVKGDRVTVVVPTYKYFHKYEDSSVYKRWRYIQNRLGKNREDVGKILGDEDGMFFTYKFKNNKLTLGKRTVVSFENEIVSMSEFSPFITFCLFIVSRN